VELLLQTTTMHEDEAAYRALASRRMWCYCLGACGVPLDQFRGPEMHFQSSEADVYHLTSLEGQKYIFKV
jgi:hypothetical protein